MSEKRSTKENWRCVPNDVEDLYTGVQHLSLTQHITSLNKVIIIFFKLKIYSKLSYRYPKNVYF